MSIEEETVKVQITFLICFEIQFLYPGIYPHGDPLGASPTFKTIIILHILMTFKRPILDLKVSLDRASQNRFQILMRRKVGKCIFRSNLLHEDQ